MRFLFHVFAALLLSALCACGEKPPVKIGFIGGLSGRFSDFGAAGRNGAQMAVDERNAHGGVQGRKVVLISQDDKQSRETAVAGVKALLQEGVAGIVGPMTSTVAVAIVPIANEAGIPIISPTATTSSLTGHDDQFFRVISEVQVFAGAMAHTLRKSPKLQKAVVITDNANSEYADNWAKEFARVFRDEGGKMLPVVTFNSLEKRDYETVATRALRDRPDAVALVTNSVDAAMLSQKLRQIDSKVALAGSDWASSLSLIDLGGRAVEGMIEGQYHNQFDRTARFLRFRDEYFKRFGEDPGFAGTLSYDSASILLDALERQDGTMPLKAELLRQRHYQGLQGEIVFDTHGDVSRPAFQTIIRNGRFEPLP